MINPAAVRADHADRMGIRFGKPDPVSRRPRRDERYRTERLTSPLGSVLDVSASGMRIRCEARPPLNKGDAQSFVLQVEGRRIRLPGIVAWVRRSSLLSKVHEVGVRFTDQRAGVRKLLEQIGQHGFLPGGSEGGAAAASGGNASASSRGTGRTGAASADPHERALPSVGIEVDDLYALLGVARDASDAEIRSTFHTLARELHPDAGGDAADPDRFAEINKAYRVLRDPALRERYDQMLIASERSGGHAPEQAA